MDAIDELLNRGVEKIYPSREELEKVLRGNTKLTIYHGIDPTGDCLHLGHMVSLRKMRQFQDLGHHIIFMHGDFTAMIGDPTDKTAARQKLAHKQVMQNAKNYLKEAAKIIKFDGPNPAEVTFNNTWLSKLTFADVVELASNFTAQQMLERDMFQERIKSNRPIYLHEFLYPLMQGYDTVAQNADLEIGGSDQTFNMLAGRTLMKAIKNKEKFVLTMQLLAEPGTIKMSKTAGNIVGLSEKPNEMFGKIMSWSDAMINPGFILLTDLSMEKVGRMEQSLKSQSLNPMVLKKELAHQIVTELHSKDEANKAQEEFERVHQKGENPIYDISIYHIRNSEENIIDVLVKSKLATSRSEAKRLVEQGGVEIDGEKVESIKYQVESRDGQIMKVGKNRFIKITTLVS